MRLASFLNFVVALILTVRISLSAVVSRIQGRLYITSLMVTARIYHVTRRQWTT